MQETKHKVPPLPDHTSLLETWRYLKVGLDIAMLRPEEGLSRAHYSYLATATHNFCTNFESPGEYSRRLDMSLGTQFLRSELYKALENYLHSHVDSLFASLAGLTGTALLIAYGKEWTQYTRGASVVHNLFSYINRRFVRHERDGVGKGLHPVYTLAVLLWRDRLYRRLYIGSKSSLHRSIIVLLNRERDGEVIDSFLVKKTIASLVALGIDVADSARENLVLYDKTFYEPFAAETRAYYIKDSIRYLETHSVRDYVSRARACLEEEERRAAVYLHRTSVGPIGAVCEDVLVRFHMAQLQNEFERLLEADAPEDLTKLYNLLNRIPDGLQPVRAVFQAHVLKNGLEAVAAAVPETGEIDPATLTTILSNVHAKATDIVQNCLVKDVTFTACLDRACVEFVNHNKATNKSSSKAAEYVAKYTDAILKKGSKASKAADDGDADAAIARIMTVFPYLADKDVYQRFYSKYLARRLIYGLSASEDAEGSMVASLKLACGNEYTAAFQRMFKDMTVSNDLNDEFRLQRDKMGRNDLDFSALVLSTNLWPLNMPSSEFASPQEMSIAEGRFKQFYNKKFNARRLTWLPNHSRTELKVMFGGTRYILACSVYQAAILLQYNQGSDSLTLEELRTATNIARGLLTPLLDQLVKQKVLEKSDDDTYDLNIKFRSPKIRVNLNVPIKSEVAAESAGVIQAVEEDRKLEIQAQLVRICKARKTIRMPNLINEAVEQLSKRFQPEVRIIKQQIQDLIEKEYLERGEERDIINYLA